MIEPTKRPWHTSGLTIFARGASANPCIAEVAESFADEAVNLANAEFIIRAVNSHDGLLAACEVAKVLLDEMGWISEDTEVCELVKQLRAAIAKAKGEDDDSD